ncbi:hypothetical protein [Ideonella sp. BN130291]|uniref:hypothetical protein n=1 Tax=Ideonella sp. BN130291 TaxID=3112940 RepID=UPI002E2660FF|nr:hypothetical protein [Ideonella sp. BN130291]
MADWIDTLPVWTGYLRSQGLRVGVGDELRLAELARRLVEQGIGIPNATDAARWFGPLLCHSADEQQRLRAMLRTWEAMLLQVSEPAAPLSPALAAAARSLHTGRRRLNWRSPWQAAGVLLGGAIVAAVLFLAWQWMLRPVMPAPVVITPLATGADTVVATGVLWTSRAFNALLWLAPLAAAWAVLRLRRRELTVLWRGLAPRDAPTEARTLQLGKLPLFRLEALRAPLADFRRHRLVDAEGIDGARSAAATVREAGRVTLVKAKRPALPEYLLLVDLRGDDDILSALADRLAGLLREGDVRVDRFDFHGDPRRLRRIDPAGRDAGTTDLESLRAACPDHRLLVVSDGASFGDDQGRHLRSWVERLSDWPETALLTPLPPAQWGPRERTLMRRGFMLAETTPDGLKQLALQFRTERSVEQALSAGARASRFDRRMAADPYRWLTGHAPDAREAERLLLELRQVLGAQAYLYLQALAVFPLLSPKLTLALGRVLGDEQGQPLLTEAHLALLCRVPWLRSGHLPDWLRLALVRDLSPEAGEQVRAAWSTLLAPAAGEDAEQLPIEVVRQVDPALPALVARLLKRSPRYSEALLLAFLNQEDLPELAVALPEGRRREEDGPSRGLLRAMAAAALAAAIAGALWLPDWWGGVQQPRWVTGLWWGALGAGGLAVYAWYAHLRRWTPTTELPMPRFSRQSPYLRLERVRLDPDEGLLMARVYATACLGCAFLAALLQGPDPVCLGRVMLAAQLLVWAFHAKDQPAMKWWPVLMLTLMSVVWLDRGSDAGASRIELGAWLEYGAPVLAGWMAARHGWPAARAVLLLTLPAALLSWPLVDPISGHGLLVATGGSTGLLVLCLVVARFAGDSGWRSRWRSAAPPDVRVVVALMLPLGVSIGLSRSSVLGFAVGWSPELLLLASVFGLGLAWHRARWVVLLAALVAAAGTLANANEWPWPMRLDLGPGLQTRVTTIWPMAVASPLFAWVFGRETARALWEAPALPVPEAPRLMQALVMLAFLGVGIYLSVPSFNGRHSVASPILHDFVPLLAVVPAGLLLRRRRLIGLLVVAFGAWGLLLAAAVLAKSMNLPPDALRPLELPRQPGNLALFPIALGLALLLNRHADRLRQPAPEPIASPRPLPLLDWGRWTWPAALLALAVLIAPGFVRREQTTPQFDLPAEPSAAGASAPVSVPAAAEPAPTASQPLPTPVPAASVPTQGTAPYVPVPTRKTPPDVARKKASKGPVAPVRTQPDPAEQTPVEPAKAVTEPSGAANESADAPSQTRQRPRIEQQAPPPEPAAEPNQQQQRPSSVQKK